MRKKGDTVAGGGGLGKGVGLKNRRGWMNRIHIEEEAS